MSMAAPLFSASTAGSYFDFNRVATEIWDMLAKPRRVDEIFRHLSDHHDVDAATLARDVTPFLQTLVNERLVRVARSGRNAMTPAAIRRAYLREAFVAVVLARMAVRFVSPARVLPGRTARLAASIDFATNEASWISWAVEPMATRPWGNVLCCPARSQRTPCCAAAA